ncbi:hypothetical protein BOX15_Mlig024075g1 [Macrostomum lignano]|uniref:C1q domain-containing protein n=2 Tax=Macrostomum lignano TaxID=282301 RepID=A0A267H927_9PLAT|nr:hypothetical protein BOX15_Mlig024075g1 [Macrostomum lignano]
MPLSTMTCSMLLIVILLLLASLALSLPAALTKKDLAVATVIKPSLNSTLLPLVANCTTDANCLPMGLCFEGQCYHGPRKCSLINNTSSGCGNYEVCLFHTANSTVETANAANGSFGVCICQQNANRLSLAECAVANSTNAVSTMVSVSTNTTDSIAATAAKADLLVNNASAGLNTTTAAPTGPTAVIRPSTLTVELPNVVLLDGSASREGSSPIEAYSWEAVDGPLPQLSGAAAAAASGSSSSSSSSSAVSGPDPGGGGGPAWRQSVLRVRLSAGAYRLRLTVRDANGLTDSAGANVTVLPARDSPPRASAGSGIVIYLPNNRVNLTGEGSTDDRGIVSYAWTQVGDPMLSADMQGAHSKLLRLSGLVEGEYKFQLTVTDAAGQTDSANVTVLVKRRGLNRPPVIRAVPDKLEVRLPQSSVSISAEASDDTGVIAGWLWQQLDDGNKRLRLLNSTSQTVNVTGLAVGKNFRLRVTAVDQDGANSSAIASLTVLPGPNQPPKAVIAAVPARLQLDGTGGELLAIDGSASWDDKLVTGYRWTRLSNSSAAGFALNGSASQPVLLLANLLPGRYTFRLTVRDVENASGFADVAFEAVAWPSADAVVVLELRAEPASFQQQAAVAVLNQLRLVAPRLRPLGDWTAPGSGGDGLVRLRLVADNGSEGAFLPARQLVANLRRRLLPDTLDYPVADLRTETCQLTCSGRGVCDPASRTCRCHWLWMANPTAGGPNCDWSLVYVCLALAVALLLCLPPSRCLLAACRRRWRRRGSRQQQRRRRRQLLRRQRRRRRRRGDGNGGDNDNSSDYYESESADDCDYEDGAVPLASMPNDELRAIVTRRSAAASAPPSPPPPSPPSAQSVATNTQSPPPPPTPAAKEK